MIKRIRVIYVPDYAVWSGGRVFSSTESVPLSSGDVIYDKTFSKDADLRMIWRDLRENIIGYFFIVFYPSVVDLTRGPYPPTENPLVALRRQSKNIREKQSKLPDFYIWDSKKGKWHITGEGYMRRVHEKSNIDIGFAEDIKSEMFSGLDAISEIESLSERYSGTTQNFILFVYPDRYDQEVRAMFVLEITFY